MINNTKSIYGEESKRTYPFFSIPDVLVIIASVIVLLAATVPTWLSRPDIRPELFGATAALPGPTGAIFSALQRPTVPTHNVFFEAPLDVLYIQGNLEYTGWELINDAYYTEYISLAILFIFVVPVLNILFALISMLMPVFRVPMRWAQFVVGLFVFIYFLFFFDKYPYDEINSFIGIGFWVALIASFVPVLQVFLPRVAPRRVQREIKVILNEEGVLDLEGAAEMASESLYTKAFRRLSQDYLTLTMLFILALLLVFSFSAPLIENFFNVSYTDVQHGSLFLPIDSGKYLLGTDDLGRDQLARLAYAGQISLQIAFFAAILSLAIGVSLGIITGFYGGIVDDIVMWFITTLNSIPSLFLLIIVAAVLTPGKETLILILGLLGWTGTTRLVRGETFSLREREFVVSARALGASNLRIMYMHILPNLISIVVVTLMLDIGGLLLTEAGLSFLGLGVQQPTPTWGNMLTNAQTFFTKGPHLLIFPGLLISVTVLALYIIGDGIRDALDPRTND